MTRLLLADDPGAAHPAKNATAPGLPNQTRTPSKGRNPMLRTHTQIASPLRNTAPRTKDDEVTYTPDELNTLIEEAAASRVAERLRERASAHRERAELWEHATGDLADPHPVFHADEADVLELMAAIELWRAGLDQGRSA